MNPNWRSFLEAADAVFDGASDEVANFGDPAGELQAAAGRTVLVPLTHLALIEASGDDAKAFLHNQLTSDVNHLAPGQAQHSAWCTAKGRMQASFLAWRAGEAYRLALAADLEAATLTRLQMFVLRARVHLVSLTTQRPLIGVAGPQAAEALADAGLPVPEASLQTGASGEIQVVALGGDRFLVCVPEEQVAALWQKLSLKARPCGIGAWRWLDVRDAFPLVTAATREEFVPQMADFEKLGGVSFHKGCYPGQEVVARTQYLGKVKRHLYRLRSELALVAGADL